MLLKNRGGGGGGTSTEFYTPTNDPFAWAADWVNVQDYDAAGVVTTTTLAAQLNSGSTSATLASASSYAIGQDMAIPGAGVAGATLIVNITNIVGNVITFTPATSTLVSAGQTVHHDDTAAFVSALATGKHTYAPSGNYNWSSKVSITTAGQHLMGSGMYGKTMIYSRVLADDTLLMGGMYSLVSHLCVLMDSTLTPTSGALIVIGNALSPKSQVMAQNIASVNGYVGMRVDKGNNFQLDNIVISDCRRYGLHVNCPVPYGGASFNRIIIYLGSPSWRASALAGLYITEMDTTRWSNLNITGYPILIHIYSTATGVAQQMMSNLLLENQWAGSHSVKIENAGGLVQNIFFENMEIQPAGAGGGGGFYIGANCNRINVTNLTSLAGTTHGMEIYGSKISINNAQMVGSATGSNTGIQINNGASKVNISASTISGYVTGVDAISGATELTITGNNLNDNSTSMSVASGVRATSTIKNNTGFADYITSIGSAPEQVGQEALVAGVWYRAIATSGVGDWKALN